jgi:glycosyltransferase involved in cell wall biosynthesis
VNAAHRSTQNADPVVTVAMSVLNGGDYLQLAVQSIVEQTLQEWELLILDDGSTDGAIDTLLSRRDPRIIVIRDGQNKGLSARLNQAIDMARGRYLARMDHDDVSHPNRLAEQVAFLDEHPHVDLVATKCVTINELHQPVGKLPFASHHQDICGRPWMGFPMPHPTWMGRVSWFRSHYYQDPAPYCCEDNELLLRAHKTSVYHAIEPALLAYRVRSHSPWHKLWRTRKAMVAQQIKYFLMNRELGFAALSCAVMFLRVIRDLRNEIFYRAGISVSSYRAEVGSAEWIDNIGR